MNRRFRIWLLAFTPWKRVWGRLLSAVIIASATLVLLKAISHKISPYELWFFALLFAYSIAIFSRIVEQSERAVDEIQRIANLPAPRLEDVRQSMSSFSGRELRYTLLASIFCGLLHMVTIRLAFDTPLSQVWSDRDLWAAQIGTVFSWIILTTVITALIANAMEWARLGRELEVDVLQPRVLWPIGRIAVLSMLSLIGAQVFFVILIMDSGWDWISVFPGLLISFIPTLALFFIPVWPLRKRLRENKADALEAVEMQLSELSSTQNYSLKNAESVDQLARLIMLRREVQSASVWPFDTSNMMKFVLYLLIPPLTWVGAALVESMVGSIVD